MEMDTNRYTERAHTLEKGILGKESGVVHPKTKQIHPENRTITKPIRKTILPSHKTHKQRNKALCFIKAKQKIKPNKQIYRQLLWETMQ